MERVRNNFEDFRKSVLKYDKHKIHRVNNSFGVYDAYKWLRKNKWLDLGRSVTEKECYSIIRGVNKYLIEEFFNNRDIIFPYNMGKIELRKRNTHVYMDKKGKVRTDYPIDWNSTLRLWFEDGEAREGKVLVRKEEKEVYRVIYNKRKAKFKNKSFYEFMINNMLKKRLKQCIKDNSIDAFLIKN